MGVSVGVDVIVGVSVGVPVGVCVGVNVGVFVMVGVELGVFVGVTVAVLVALAVGVGVGEGRQAPLSPGVAMRKSWLVSLASMHVVNAGHATFEDVALLVQRVVAVTPSFLVKGLIEQLTLPVFVDFLMQGAECTMGFVPHVD